MGVVPCLGLPIRERERPANEPVRIEAHGFETTDEEVVVRRGGAFVELCRKVVAAPVVEADVVAPGGAAKRARASDAKCIQEYAVVINISGSARCTSSYDAVNVKAS